MLLIKTRLIFNMNSTPLVQSILTVHTYLAEITCMADLRRSAEAPVAPP